MKHFLLRIKLPVYSIGMIVILSLYNLNDKYFTLLSIDKNILSISLFYASFMENGIPKCLVSKNQHECTLLHMKVY